MCFSYINIGAAEMYMYFQIDDRIWSEDQNPPAKNR